MVLQLHGITKTFNGPTGPVPVLRGISLDLPAGSLTALRGASGSGKSTLLLIAGGLLQPDQGSVSLQGEDLSTQRAGRRAAGIGFVFQQFHLLPYLTVLDNILLPALNRASGANVKRAQALAEKFGLGHRLSHRPAALSTGERQRVALARALVNEPAVLLADEPTGNLDQDLAQQVLNCLRDFAAAGGAVLLVTHDPLAAAQATRRMVLDHGQLAMADAPTAGTP